MIGLSGNLHIKSDGLVAELFYADPVDEDGNVIGTATMGPVQTPWGEITPTKVPAAEIPLDHTLHVQIPEGAEEPGGDFYCSPCGRYEPCERCPKPPGDFGSDR